MRKCIATVCLSGTLTAKLDAISAARFDAIEVFENDLINFPGTPADLKRMAATAGSASTSTSRFATSKRVSDEQFKRNLDRAERKFDIMQTLGAPMMLVCANVVATARSTDDARDRRATACELAERAARRNMRVGYEALAWSSARQPLRARVEDRARSRASPPRHHPRQLSHPFARRRSRGDCRHPRRQDLLPADGRRTAARRWTCCSGAGITADFPGQGQFDLPRFLEQVLVAGYTGPLSLEIFNDVFREAPNRRTAVDAMQSLLYLEEQTRLRLESATRRTARAR